MNFQIQIVQDEKDDNNEFLNSNKLKREDEFIKLAVQNFPNQIHNP